MIPTFVALNRCATILVGINIIREFFHLLILECLNPQYALFQCVNGLYKPNPNSCVNSNHLFYFTFFGKVLARCICDSKLAMFDCMII